MNVEVVQLQKTTHSSQKDLKKEKATYMFACDVPHVTDIHDATLMPDDAHSDGVFTHFGGYIAIHFDPQLFEHQQPCKQPGERSHRTQKTWHC